jgi:hypothetical protein
MGTNTPLTHFFFVLILAPTFFVVDFGVWLEM